MGINDLWKVIEPSQKEFTLEQIASNHFNKKKGKGLRVAIDVALWIFQAKTSVAESSVEGDQSELRTLFFRLCRLYELGIRSVFVFDGPNRPAYKRNKLINTAPPDSQFQNNLLSLIRHFNFSIWDAYGDAEAECAALQRLGIVDLVITGDSDVLLFGAGRVMRHWPNKRNDPVACYDMRWIQNEIGLDRSDLILIALLRGSDYDTQGTHGVGIQLATGLSRCHYHRDLFDNTKRAGREQALDEEKINQLYDQLTYELHHNTQGKLQRRHTTIQLSPKFPDFFVVTDFILPITHIESADYISQARKLTTNLNDYYEPDWACLASFVQHAFKWPMDYLIKRFSLLIFPGYMSNILRLQQFNKKPKVPIKKSKQTKLDDYFKLTSKYCPENGVIAQITANKVVSDTVQLYRVEWNSAYLKVFHDKIRSLLDKDVYRDIIPFEEKERLDNVWSSVKRQWVNATLIHNVYPFLALEYQSKNKKDNSAFLVKPLKRQKFTKQHSHVTAVSYKKK